MKQKKIGLAGALRIWSSGKISPLQVATTQLQEAEIKLLEHQLTLEIYQSECSMLASRIGRLKEEIRVKTLEDENDRQTAN